MTVVYGFIHQADDQEPAKGRQTGGNPVSVRPWHFVNHKSGDQWSNIGRNNDGAGPDVYFSGMLMEEEDILDDHQALLAWNVSIVCTVVLNSPYPPPGRQSRRSHSRS